MKTQTVEAAQPAPISMSGAIEPGAGMRCRLRAPLRINARTSVIGWELKIQPPSATLAPSLISATASSAETILLLVIGLQPVGLIGVRSGKFALEIAAPVDLLAQQFEFPIGRHGRHGRRSLDDKVKGGSVADLLQRHAGAD